MTMKNQVEDSEGNIKVLGDPLMNDLGVSSILGIISSCMNRNTIMSNLDEQEIANLMEFLADTLAQDLMMNRVNYAIKTTTARTKIFFSCLTSVFVVYKRGFEEGDKRFWKGTQQDITMRNEGSSQKKGMMNRFMSLIK